MPELPEVENVRIALQSSILNRKIISIQIKTKKIIRSKTAFLKDKLIGATVVSINRKGKNLILAISNTYFLIIHLGMTGQILLKNVSDNKDALAHLIIKFEGHPPYLIYRDTRKFGYFNIISETNLKLFLKKIGPDILRFIRV